MDTFPGADLTVFRGKLPKLDSVMFSGMRSRRNSGKDRMETDSASSSSSSRNDELAFKASPSKPQKGSSFISPSHEFDHAGALNMVKSARLAGLDLPENADFIFLPPASTSSAGTSSSTSTLAVSLLDFKVDAAELIPMALNIASPSPGPRKRVATSTKKFVTAAFPSAVGNEMESLREPVVEAVSVRASGRKRANSDFSESADDSALEDASSEPEYQIEEIVKKRTTHGNRVRYLIKWVGSEVLTWEPRTNFASDNDAWLRFKQDQRDKRGSAAKSARMGKRMSRDKSKELGPDVVMISPIKTSDDDAVDQSTSKASTGLPDEIMEDKDVKLLAEQDAERAEEQKVRFAKSVTIIPVEKTTTQQNMVAESHPSKSTIISGPLAANQASPGPSTSAASLQSSAPVTPSPLRNIAPQPKPTPKPTVPLAPASVRRGDVYVYVPSRLTAPSAGSFLSTISQPSPSSASSVVTRISIMEPQRRNLSSPEIVVPRIQQRVVARPSAPGLSLPTRAVNGSPGPRMIMLNSPGLRPIQPAFHVAMSSSPQRMGGLMQLSTKRPVLIATPPPSAVSSWPTSNSFLRPTIPITPNSALLSMPRSIALVAPQTMPARVISNRPLLQPSGAVGRAKEVGINTTLTLVTAKEVTVHAGVGRSGLDDAGALVVNISGFRPRDVAITALDDIAFLVTYANRDSEFVDYQECIRKIPHEVAEFLFKNRINAVDTPPLRILA